MFKRFVYTGVAFHGEESLQRIRLGGQTESEYHKHYIEKRTVKSVSKKKYRAANLAPAPRRSASKELSKQEELPTRSEQLLFPPNWKTLIFASESLTHKKK